MAYTVTFGTIYKRVNSTLNTYTPVFTASCVMKEPCDLLNPTFTLQVQNTELLHNNMNYMEVAELGRFYWITSMTFVLGHWEVSGKVDVLGTYKTDIGAHPQYIVRASATFDGRIPDSYAVAKASPIIQPMTGPIGLNATGCYVICTAGKTGNKFYMMYGATWETLYASIFTSGFLNDYYNAWDAIVQDVVNTVLNPADYILSAKWLPCTPTGNYENISLGFHDTGVPAYVVQPGTVVMTSVFDWTIPDHPQAASYGYYLNSNPFRKIGLFLPGYGNIVIDPDIVATANNLYIKAELDISGALTYSISLLSSGNRVWTTAVTCDVSTDAGFATQKSGITSALSAVAGGFAAGGVAGALAEGAASAVHNAIPQVERASVGGSRSILATDGLIVCTIEYYEIAAPAPAAIGLPLCVYAALSGYNGFIQCRNASVPCNGTQTEIEEINSFLNGGFFYE